MPKIGFIYTTGRKERLSLIKNKKAPADFFYGCLELKKRGYAIDIIEDKDIPQFRSNKIFTYFLTKISSILGVSINLVFRLSRSSILFRLNNLDTIVATTNSYGLALAALRFWGKLRPHVVFLAMAPLSPRDNIIKKFICKKLLKTVILASENRNEISFLEKELPERKGKIFYIPFGVDPQFWAPLHPPQPPEEKYVLSIGNDAMRDYETLVKSWKSGYPLLKIITRLPIRQSLPKNVLLIKGDWKQQCLSDNQIREHIQKSLFVIIPTKESLQSSGQSVCMESMACGKAVIISKTLGLWDEEVMKDGKNCLLVKPYSIRDIQKKLKKLLNNPTQLMEIGKNARKTLIEHYTIKHLTDRIERILRDNF